jgi:predicted Co/Zn/Cd cation transporter (cation efflux family)
VAAGAEGGGVVVTLLLRRTGTRNLVLAKAAEWLSDTLLSIGVLIGFALRSIVATGHRNLAAYVDPAMVLLLSAAFLRVLARLVADGPGNPLDSATGRHPGRAAGVPG